MAVAGALSTDPPCIKDESDDLLEYIASGEKHCEEAKVTLETQITNDEDMLSSAQTKLGSTTEKEATAGETARQTAAENEKKEQGLIKTMRTCSMSSQKAGMCMRGQPHHPSPD